MGDLINGILEHSIKTAIPPGIEKTTQSSRSSSNTPTPMQPSDDSDDEEDTDPPTIAQYVELQTSLFKLHSNDMRDSTDTTLNADIQRLENKLARITRDPLFEKRDADLEWDACKRVLTIEVAQAKANQKDSSHTSETSSTFQQMSRSTDNLQDKGHRVEADTEAEGDMLTGLFDIGDALPGGDTSQNSITIRKDFGKWSGASPRRILEDVCKSR